MIRDTNSFSLGVLLESSLLVWGFVAWPILIWPWIAAETRFPEASWQGYLGWVVLWFPICMVVSLVVIIAVESFSRGNNPVGGTGAARGMGQAIGFGFFMIGVAAVYPAVWLAPRVLIRPLWPGAFAVDVESLGPARSLAITHTKEADESSTSFMFLWAVPLAVIGLYFVMRLVSVFRAG